MLARTPSKLINVQICTIARKLNRNRKEAIREKIVDLAHTAEPTPFAIEGPCRAGIRASLCLQGWKWADADLVAGEIVIGALNIAGAERPTWQQGQPEWTQPGVHRVQHDRCLRCRKPMPDDHWRFCGKVCAGAWHVDRQRQYRADEINALTRARKAAWSAKQPEQPCEGCRSMFKPRKPGQRFCRQQCVGIVYGGSK